MDRVRKSTDTTCPHVDRTCLCCSDDWQCEYNYKHVLVDSPDMSLINHNELCDIAFRFIDLATYISKMEQQLRMLDVHSRDECLDTLYELQREAGWAGRAIQNTLNLTLKMEEMLMTGR